MKEENIKKELEELSPLLAKLKAKKNKTEIPKNYFAYLENSVMQQVELEPTPVLQTTVGTTVPLWSHFFSWRGMMTFASVILLVLVGLFGGQRQALEESTVLQFADLTDAEILSYLTDNAEELDVYSLEVEAEENSALDMIEFEEGEADYFLEDVTTDVLADEIF